MTILQSLQAYHASEIARMDGVIERIKGDRERNDLFENCVSKKNKHIAEQKKINQEIEGLT